MALESRYTFGFVGMDELKADLNKMLKEYPEETERQMYRFAGQFTKDVNAKMPESYNNTSSWQNPIPDAWDREKEKGVFNGYTVSINIRNKSKHWHLVENGHDIKGNPNMARGVLSGAVDFKKDCKSKKKRTTKSLGFAKGKHYCQDTRDEWENGKFEIKIKKFLKRMRKKHNL